MAEERSNGGGAEPSAAPAAGGRGPLARSIRTALVVFALVLAAILIAAWLAGDEQLRFVYEGFD